MISPVLAGDASLVEATYYHLDSENPGKYRKLVTWQINNESEWVGFTTKVRGSSCRGSYRQPDEREVRRNSPVAQSIGYDYPRRFLYYEKWY